MKTRPNQAWNLTEQTQDSQTLCSVSGSYCGIGSNGLVQASHSVLQHIVSFLGQSYSITSPILRVSHGTAISNSFRSLLQLRLQHCRVTSAQDFWQHNGTHCLPSAASWNLGTRLHGPTALAVVALQNYNHEIDTAKFCSQFKTWSGPMQQQLE